MRLGVISQVDVCLVGPEDYVPDQTLRDFGRTRWTGAPSDEFQREGLNECLGLVGATS
jgi:hypothetical protein